MDLKWQIMLIDDDQEIGALLKEHLESIRIANKNIDVEYVENFSVGNEKLHKKHFDVLILDVRQGSPHESINHEEEGIKTFNEIKERRFLPIIYYTALSNQVKKCSNPPLIQVVDKEPSFNNLDSALEMTFNSHIPTINRALIEHFHRVQAKYMWDFVCGNWKHFNQKEVASIDLAYMLGRRLGVSVSMEEMTNLANKINGLRDIQEEIVDGVGVHPMRYYVMPPIHTLMTGDICKIEGRKDYFIVVTPACDILQDKTDHILLSQCILLNTMDEYKEIVKLKSSGEIEEKKMKSAKNKLNDLVKKRPRYFFLPKALDIPDLLADFQNITNVDKSGFKSLKCIASLDSPFLEKFIQHFSQYYGRVGTPDLDMSQIVDRIDI